MPAVIKGEVDAGLIIHESRFTYGNFDLQLIADLGAWWEDYSGLPIPLGGIIASRQLPEGLIKKFDSLLQESVKLMMQTDWKKNPQVLEFIRLHSQEIEPAVLKAHIETYVNEDSVSLSAEARRAIEKLFTVAEERGFIPPCELPLFSEELS